MNNKWYSEAIFYHIYPLGFSGAERRNNFFQSPGRGFQKLYPWLDYLKDLGVTALYLGPLFQATTHGYDTADYYHVDRRLGSNEDFKELCREIKRRGIRIILDGVFHHVGRDFWAFRDVQANGAASRYKEWFSGLRFDGRSPFGDSFTYEAWNGHYELVKLNTGHPEVRDHIFGAVHSWIRDYDIDGLRLDVADCLDHGFMQALSAYTAAVKEDFFLVGEVIHGDYNNWVRPEELHSVTNYECYKGIHSAHNDRNLFEIAYSLERQQGPYGIYAGKRLYNFLDNHDVNRIASILKDPAHYYTASLLLFTIPGIPSLYYGSEWAVPGKRLDHDDAPLRPELSLHEWRSRGRDPEAVVKKLIAIRKGTPALVHGDYERIVTESEVMVFRRKWRDEVIYVALNISGENRLVDIPSPGRGLLCDLLNPGDMFAASGRAVALPLYPNWGRILRFKAGE